jgi:general secretion pathway protein A
LPLDEAVIWRELGGAWGLTPEAAVQACQTEVQPRLRCFRSNALTLAHLHLLDRPALLGLRGADGRPRHARLAGLGAAGVVLAAAGRTWRLPSEQFLRAWHGGYATLWRAPEGYQHPLGRGARGAAVDALAHGLATLQQTPLPLPGQAIDEALEGRLRAFQREQGLQPDGVAGPVTWMLLARALGQAEPRLPALKEH